MSENPLIKLMRKETIKQSKPKTESKLRRGEIVFKENDIRVLGKVIGRAIALMFLLPSYFLISHFFSIRDLITGLIISMFYLVAVIGFLLWLYYKVVLASTKRRH